MAIESMSSIKKGGVDAFTPGGTGSGIERPVLVDAARPIAYVGYLDRIMRLDYATYPPAQSFFYTASVYTDWPNRSTLGYT